MSKRSNKVYLEDILESINCIFDYLGDKTEFEFMQSLLIQDAVTRRFEIIGEASSKIDVDYKLKYPEIEWNLMKDMRNKLIHEYFGVSNSTKMKKVVKTTFLFSSGDRTRTDDLWVMSPTSYHLLHPAVN
jgi:uncharacterized protein with HEPN domain